jgi:hypothetical protein
MAMSDPIGPENEACKAEVQQSSYPCAEFFLGFPPARLPDVDDRRSSYPQLSRSVIGTVGSPSRFKPRPFK